MLSILPILLVLGNTIVLPSTLLSYLVCFSISMNFATAAI